MLREKSCHDISKMVRSKGSVNFLLPWLLPRIWNRCAHTTSHILLLKCYASIIQVFVGDSTTNLYGKTYTSKSWYNDRLCLDNIIPSVGSLDHSMAFHWRTVSTYNGLSWCLLRKIRNLKPLKVLKHRLKRDMMVAAKVGLYGGQLFNLHNVFPWP